MEYKDKCTLAKTKTVVFKKGRTLSMDEKLWFGGEEREIVNEIKYLGVVLDTRSKWRKR